MHSKTIRIVSLILCIFAATMLFAGCFNEEYDESSVGEMSSDAATSSDD
ncbi:MAG: hypothetical protein PUA58_05940 [Ruminococcus sp.]|nr:hypothetical protein [Ruminococcus sp.]